MICSARKKTFHCSYMSPVTLTIVTLSGTSSDLLVSTTSSIGYHLWRKCGGTDSALRLRLSLWLGRSQTKCVFFCTPTAPSNTADTIQERQRCFWCCELATDPRYQRCGFATAIISHVRNVSIIFKSCFAYCLHAFALNSPGDKAKSSVFPLQLK